MKTEIERKFLEINSIQDLSGALPPNESCKISLIDPPDFQLNKFFINKLVKIADGSIDLYGTIKHGLNMLIIKMLKHIY